MKKGGDFFGKIVSFSVWAHTKRLLFSMGPNTAKLWFYFFGLKVNFWPPMDASYISPPLA
jgi:hypothetical protein